MVRPVDSIVLMPREEGRGPWRSSEEDQDEREEEANGDDDDPRLRSSMVRAAADDGVGRRHTWAAPRLRRNIGPIQCRTSIARNYGRSCWCTAIPLPATLAGAARAADLIVACLHRRDIPGGGDR